MVRLRCWVAAWALAAVAAGGEESSSGEGGAEVLADESGAIQTITIVGTREDAQAMPGGAHLIDAEQLARFAYADVQRAMRQMPGVSLQVEDGYGLRPNIGIRAVATERSARITLLEDGVLIAPAPYSAPSAYYFPTPGRMSALEVLKGPAAITQGPYTIGGALNMVSTPIPVERGGRVLAETGQHASNRLHATYGGSLASGLGFLLETHQWVSDGFQTIDRGGDSGLDVRDYTLKLALDRGPHRLSLKLQKADQESQQSYLGLTDADFDADPSRRYGLSDLDGIDTSHEQLILRHEYDSDALRFGITAYRNKHARDWFKTEGMDLDGAPDAQSQSRVSWASIVQSVNRGTGRGDWSAAALQGVLNGNIDTPHGSIQLRSNNREYLSQGIQLEGALTRNIGAVAHTLRVGIRYHEDDEDRLQRNSAYSQRNGRLVLDDLGLLGNAGNRIQEASAIALFVQDTIEFGAFTLMPGLRFEDIDQKRTRYETRAGRTANPASRAGDNLRSTRSNSTQVLLPGLGALYRIDNGTTLVAGVHKGFTAPTNAPDVDAEEALNYEFGLRFDNGRTHFEAIGFLSDYDNLLGVCTSSSGVDCEAGDAFNGDAATVRGVELMATTNLAPLDAGFSLPLEVAYTWLKGEFDADIADTDFFGNVSAGDPLPYLAPRQFNALLGVERGRWEGYASLNHIAAVCVRASCGAFEKTDATLTLDLSTHFAWRPGAKLFARIENVTDAQDIVGRHPYGARPNRSRTAAVGVDIAW